MSIFKLNITSTSKTSLITLYLFATGVSSAATFFAHSIPCRVCLPACRARPAIARSLFSTWHRACGRGSFTANDDKNKYSTNYRDCRRYRVNNWVQQEAQRCVRQHLNSGEIFRRIKLSGEKAKRPAVDEVRSDACREQWYYLSFPNAFRH